MKHPWVNILILVFVTVEFVSGFFGLVSGLRDEAVFIIIHRIAGYGLVVLLVWKVAVILFALRNRKRGRMERTGSLVLFGLLVVTLGLGFAWSAAGPYFYRPPSGINVERGELARLHQRPADSSRRDARHHLHQVVPAAVVVLGRAPVVPALRGRRARRAALLADGGASRTRCRTERQGPSLHRLVRGHTHQRRFPRGLVAQ